MRGTKRRGFRTSIVHGVHRFTAGVVIKVIAGVAKVLYFPDVHVVLSSSNVVTLLQKGAQQPPRDQDSARNTSRS